MQSDNSEENPELIRIAVRSVDGPENDRGERDRWIVAGLNHPPEDSQPHYGVIVRNLLEGSRSGRSGARQLTSIPVREELGRVLFASKEVRSALAHHVGLGHYVRLILDLEEDTSGANWEAALPHGAGSGSAPVAQPDEPWNDMPDLPIGLWDNVSIVRLSTHVSPRTSNLAERLFTRADPSVFVIDAREAGGASLADVELPDAPDSPFSFTVAASSRPAVLSSRAISDHQIFHFAGHGSASALKFDGAWVSWNRAREAFEGSQLRLAVLTACSTGADNPLGDQISFAWNLAAVIPGVIAMLADVRTDSANLFTRLLYEDLATGRPVDFAVARARRALHRERTSVGPDDWMLPVLFLATPGSAGVPFRSDDDDVDSMPSALALIEAGTGRHPVLLRVVAGHSFRDVPARAKASGPPIVSSADGQVSAALVDDGLLLAFHGRPPQVDRSFSEGFDPGPGPLTLIAARAARDSGLEIAVTAGATTWLIQRSPSGQWSRPRPASASGRATTGVFLGEGFLGWDDSRAEFIGAGSASTPSMVTAELQLIAGLDAVTLDRHDVVATWGTGWDDEPACLILARRRGSSAWTPVGPSDVRAVQLGLVRPRTRMAGVPAPSAPAVVVGYRYSDGAIDVRPAIDLSRIA